MAAPFDGPVYKTRACGKGCGLYRGFGQEVRAFLDKMAGSEGLEPPTLRFEA